MGYNCVIKEYVKYYLGLELYDSPFDYNIIDNISKIETLLENNFQERNIKSYISLLNFSNKIIAQIKIIYLFVILNMKLDLCMMLYLKKKKIFITMIQI